MSLYRGITPPGALLPPAKIPEVAGGQPQTFADASATEQAAKPLAQSGANWTSLIGVVSSLLILIAGALGITVSAQHATLITAGLGLLGFTAFWFMRRHNRKLAVSNQEILDLLQTVAEFIKAISAARQPHTNSIGDITKKAGNQL